MRQPNRSQQLPSVRSLFAFLFALTIAACGQSTTWIETDATWTWNGSAFQLENPEHRPPPREAAAAAYDPGHTYVLLYGGRRCQPAMMASVSCQSFHDTWSWDGKTWLSHSPRHAPDGAIGTMVYDEHMRRLIFVSSSGSGWGWDGEDWTQAWSPSEIDAPFAPPIQPLDSSHLAVGYDEQQRELIVLSIRVVTDASTSKITQTWIFVTSGWDGSRWRKVSAQTGQTNVADDPGGPDYQYGRLAYDRGRHHLVAMGIKRLWMWNGTTWTGQPPGYAVMPAASDGGALLYDPRKQRLLWLQGSLDGRHYHGTRVVYEQKADTWTLIPAANQPFVDNPTIAFDEARGNVLLFGGNAES